jgi:hypothetical protein
MREEDILILIYPNAFIPQKVVIIDPYDNKIQQFNTSSLEEVKEVLKQNLPFCDQHHAPTLHLGSAYVVEWENLGATKLVIKKPEDIENLR